MTYTINTLKIYICILDFKTLFKFVSLISFSNLRANFDRVRIYRYNCINYNNFLNNEFK